MAPQSPPATYADRIQQPPAQGGWRQRYGDGTLAPEQFNSGVDAETARAICGEVAAVAFARAYGRNPTVAEALEIARRNGRWDANVGMHGPPSEQALLDDMGIPNRLEPNPSQDAVLRDLDNGNPVILSSPGHYHYFVVTGYRRQADGSILYDTGNTGMVFKNNPHRYWGWDEIGPQAALFLQEPSAQGASVATAADMAPQQGTPAVASGTAPADISAVGVQGRMAPQQFVDTLLPVARAHSARTGIPVEYYLAAAAHESGWGGSGNTLFGIKGAGATFATYEVEDGRDVPQNASFRTYPNADAAFSDFDQLVTQGRYAPAYQQFQKTGNAHQFWNDITAAGYATDRTWGDKIARMADGTIAPLVAGSTPSTGQGRYTSTSGAVAGRQSGTAEYQSPFAPAEQPYTNTVDPSTRDVADPWAPVRATEARVRQGIADLGRGAAAGAAPLVGGAADTARGLVQPVVGAEQAGAEAVGGAIARGAEAAQPYTVQPSTIESARGVVRGQMLLPENFQGPFSDPYMEQMAVRAAGPNPTHDDLVNARLALMRGLSTFGAADVGVEGMAGKLLGGAAEGRALLGAEEAAGRGVGGIVGQAQDLWSRFYHGTGSSFDTPDPARFDPNGLFGPGLYLTDSAEVAGRPPDLFAGRTSRSYAFKGEERGIWSADNRSLGANLDEVAKNLASAESELAKEGQYAGGVTPQRARDLRGLIGDYRAALEQGSGPNVRAVDVPKGLNLLDADAPTTAEDVRSVLDAMPDARARENFLKHAFYQDEATSTPIRNGDELYAATRRAAALIDVHEGGALLDHKIVTNRILLDAGYDGIRYAGGKRIPMADAAGVPIEHTAVVIFPESLPKIRNALSGMAGGITAEATSRFGTPTLAGDLGRPPTTLAARGVGTVAGGVIGAAAPADTPEDRLRHAAIGAGVGLGLDVGAPLLSRQLTQRAERAYLRGMRGTTVAAVRGAEDAKLAAGGGLDVGGKLLTINEHMFNRFARLWGLGQDVRDAIQGLGGSQANVKAILETELRPILRSVPSLSALNDYLIARQIPELEAAGFKTPRGMTSAQATADLARMQATLGAAKFKAIEDAAQRIYAFEDTHLLQRAIDSGLISRDAADAMRAANKAYFPHQVFDREMTSGGAGGAYRDSVSVSQSGIKRRQGSALDIRQPLDAIINRTYALNTVADRNEAANVVIDALDREGIATRRTSDALPPVGQEKISRLVEGVHEEWIVPREIAGAVKQMDSATASAFERIFGKLNGISRAGYTVFSPAFLARNIERDLVDRFFRRGRLPDADYARGLFAAITHDASWEAFMREHGGYSGLAERIATRSTVADLARSGGNRLVRTVTNPFELMRSINEVAEQGPKIGDFVHYRKQGMPPRRAGIMAREGTVDYWMGGTTAKQLNPIVMFLNANMRALYNAGEPLAVGTPKQRISAALRLSTLALAATGVYEWNRHFRYQTGDKKGQPIAPDIPQYDQNVGWAILTGETRNEKGETVPTYIRVPKPTALVPVGMLIDEMMKSVRGRPGQGIVPAAAGLVAGMSPVNPSDVGGTILPPVIQAPEEVARNYSDFRQAPIEPDAVHRQLPEYREVGGTTETARAISRTRIPGVGSAAENIGLSAPQVDYLGHNILGGIYDTATYAADAGLRAGGLAPAKPPTTDAIGVARNPFTRGVFAARGGQEDQRLYGDYQAKRDAAVRVATEALPTLVPNWATLSKDEQDKWRLGVQTKVDQQLRERATEGTLPSFLEPTQPDRPWRFDPRIYDLLAQRFPPDRVQRWRDDPFSLERDVAAAARVEADWLATRKQSPMPTEEQRLLAELAKDKYDSREYSLWRRDPQRRLDDVQRRQQIQGAVGAGVGAP